MRTRREHDGMAIMKRRQFTVRMSNGVTFTGTNAEIAVAAALEARRQVQIAREAAEEARGFAHEL